MLGLELIVALGVCILVCSVAARRLRIASPMVLLIGGVLLGFVPALRAVHLPPEVVLLVFLPALLYWETLTTSLREIRNNLRVIVLVSTALVFVTAAAVAAVAHALGLAWGPAWVLGAALAPTDATVIAVMARALPRRTVTILRAESLINDGTALVIYGLAVGITVGDEQLNAGHISWMFVVSYAGGAIAGLVTAGLAVWARRHLDSSVLENVISVLTPFVAFLLAEWLHASGVLAVVVCALTLSQFGPRIVSAVTRQQAIAFWGLTTFMLNASLFVLVGLAANASFRALDSDLGKALMAVAVISGVVIGVRFLWFFTTPYLIRAIDRRPRQRLRRVGPRPRVVSAMAGFRGAISMAAALAIPERLASGAPFPDRNLIIFVTAGVIVVTLFLQGLPFRRVIRWARMPGNDDVEEERKLAQRMATEEAYASIPEVASRLEVNEDAFSRTTKEYEAHLKAMKAGKVEDDDYTKLRLALLGRKRATIIRLRDERVIDDTVLRQIQSRLDVEEVRLSRPDPDAE